MRSAAPSILPHDLLKLVDDADLISDAPRPEWLDTVMRAAPWVVVRRAMLEDGRIPVGVRGATRNARWAAWVAPSYVADAVRPEGLTKHLSYLPPERLASLPALAALMPLGLTLHHHGLVWGPTGSVGFELATGVATVTATSDLDAVVRCDQRLLRDTAADLVERIADLGVRCDLILETPAGGVALLEYARVDGAVVARGVNGPRLVDDPWPVGHEDRQS